MSRTFTIVDVFAQAKYKGNQLAVVRNAAGLETVEMQAIAREWNFAETTFILSDSQREGATTCAFLPPPAKCHSQDIPHLARLSPYVRKSSASRWTRSRSTSRSVKSPSPLMVLALDEANSTQVHADLHPRAARPRLELNEGDFDTHFPIQEVSTGLGLILEPLKGMDAVKRAHVTRERLKELIAPLQAKMIFLFSAET